MASSVCRLLVANRGEIARRIFRTCRDLGIDTVAVFAANDADAPHVTDADSAVEVTSYLDGDDIVQAALAAGADAVHPGYGFLAEHAGFARLVVAAGLTWVGPPPDVIETMGSKPAAKQLARGVGVPVLPELAAASITTADLPVLIKAAAGGGGRGMRVVTELAELPAALAEAQSEAAATSGDSSVFCEPYLAAARHIEVQIVADQHGTVRSLGERDCSMQRRHQKVIEEAPAPGITAQLREQLAHAAVMITQAAGYVNAGTVEFLAIDGSHFFLEMNTRLQVEHPVTECVTGLDLVRLQLEIASGAPLGDVAEITGHAIEARLYAEDPAADWRPQHGTLHTFDIPARDGLRVDASVTRGTPVGVHYDPMLAKVIAWAPTRDEAASKLAAALAEARIHGVVTNRDLLVRVLRDPDFQRGRLSTGMLTERRAELSEPLATPQARTASAVAAALAGAATNRCQATVLGELPSGWRNLPALPQRAAFRAGDEVIEVRYRFTRTGVTLVDGAIDVVRVTPGQVILRLGRVQHRFAVAVHGDMSYVGSALGPVVLQRVPRFPVPEPELPPGSLTAPMPGTVVRVATAAGDQVDAGQPLLWLEAMKMEHQLAAPAAGIVAAVHAEPGQQVDVGTVLVVLEVDSGDIPR